MTILVPYDPDFHSLEKSHQDFHQNIFYSKRRALISNLQKIQGIPRIAKSLNPDETYKFVFPEGRFLQKGKDGLYEGVLRGRGGRIANHAKFKKIPPNINKIAVDVGSQIILIYIATQLDSIQRKIDDLFIEFHNDRIAEIKAGIIQYELAFSITPASKRSNEIQHAIQILHPALHKTLPELQKRIADLPDPNDSSIWDNLFKTKTSIATEKMELAEECFYSCIKGIKALAECYASLGSHKTAAKALYYYFKKLSDCKIESAAKKARLVEYKGKQLPERMWNEFLEKKPRMLESIGNLGSNPDIIEVEFKPKEFMEGT